MQLDKRNKRILEKRDKYISIDFLLMVTTFHETQTLFITYQKLTWLKRSFKLTWNDGLISGMHCIYILVGFIIIMLQA